MQKWKKGNGEMIGFAIAGLVICSIFLIMVSFLQLSVGLNSISKALNVVGRSVAVCTSKEDAETQAQRVAENSITYINVEDPQTSVDYVTAGDEWQSGVFVRVKVSGMVKTMAPFINRRYEKNVLICIENEDSDSAVEVCMNIIYAVETGGQVYGGRDYGDFTPSYANSGAEHAITIGAGGWYGTEAQRLLLRIRSEHPDVFRRLDTAGIGNDLDNCNWSSYSVSAGSAQAVAIHNIISSSEGQACQDEQMRDQIERYFAEAEALGVTDNGAKIEYVNARHQGGLGTAQSVVRSAARPYTADTMYAAIMSRTGVNQIGTYVSRQQKVYQWIREYL